MSEFRSMDEALEHAVRLVDAARSVAVLTGAGISTDSGIPDFRGPNGVWTRDPAAERRSNINTYLADPQVRMDAWRIRSRSEMFDAQPNEAHRALVALDDRLHTLVTQNIDGLHQRAGTPADRVVEIHGTVHGWECVECGARGPMRDAIDRVRAGEDDPPCELCGGIIKSATILFGQGLVRTDLERAERAAVEADLLLAIGTSLSVYPVAGMVPTAVEVGRPVIIVNAEPTDLDHLATVVLRGSAAELLSALLIR